MNSNSQNDQRSIPKYAARVPASIQTPDVVETARRVGIEKIVEKLEHVPPLYSLLTRSATGQNISTYFNMISRPRQPGEKDGPGEVHLVLLDNGRSQAYADEQLRK